MLKLIREKDKGWDEKGHGESPENHQWEMV